jgi:hypothetical protein
MDAILFSSEVMYVISDFEDMRSKLPVRSVSGVIGYSVIVVLNGNSTNMINSLVDDLFNPPEFTSNSPA